MQPAQGVIAQLPVESSQGYAGGTRVGEQRAYGLQATVSQAQATQGFHAGNAAGGGIDERLEAGERLPVDHKASLREVAKKGPPLVNKRPGRFC